MPDVFTEAITRLVDACPGVTGAAFADHDGEEIALYPRKRAESLRLCAAYTGIAIRRLSGAEARAGRKPVRSVVLSGAEGSLLAVQVGKEYQLVVSLEAAASAARVLPAAEATAVTLEENL